MNYNQIYRADLADGLGVRVSLFVSGCSHHCPGCFNPKTWDEDYGRPYTKDTEDFILQELSKPYIRGLSLLGGEPLEPCHLTDIYNLVSRVKKDLPQKNIWIYSGSTYEELMNRSDDTKKILDLCDVLVDGRFILEQRDVSIAFRGSRNQRIIDLKNSTLDHIEILQLDRVS